VKILRHVLLSALFGATIVLAVLFVIAATSVLETFQIYPHDALFLIELVVTFLVASAGGLLCFQHLRSGHTT
jgi:ABC-type nickel/cobalt efflux system permease component RcnA